MRKPRTEDEGRHYLLLATHYSLLSDAIDGAYRWWKTEVGNSRARRAEATSYAQAGFVTRQIVSVLSSPSVPSVTDRFCSDPLPAMRSVRLTVPRIAALARSGGGEEQVKK